MNIFPLRSEADYNRALAQAEKLMDAKNGTDEADELEILSILIEKYENEHFPIDIIDPVSAIEFRLEQMGKSQKDLSSLIGANRASEILNRKRDISKEAAIKIHHAYGIPYENLLGHLKKEYHSGR
jgi:HTH-type transcriptional regulator/antitoxin HigA